MAVVAREPHCGALLWAAPEQLFVLCQALLEWQQLPLVPRDSFDSEVTCSGGMGVYSLAAQGCVGAGVEQSC